MNQNDVGRASTTGDNADEAMRVRRSAITPDAASPSSANLTAVAAARGSRFALTIA